MKMINKKTVIILLAIVCVVVFFSIVNKNFLSLVNIGEIIIRVAELSPIALGIMVVLIVKGIDLSPGMSIGLLGIISVSFIAKGSPLIVGLTIAFAFALIIGLLNGILIAKFNMNPFITTLAMMFIGMSLEKVLTRGGLPIYLYGGTSGFGQIYREKIKGLPLPILILLIILICLSIVLNKTVYGRRLYASGLSVKGAINSGIPVRNYFASAYVISSILVFFSAIFIASKVRSGQPLIGQSYLWDAIGAAYLSTILSDTKRPNVGGTVIGVVFLAILTNGLTMFGLQFYWKTFFRGFLILFILIASTLDMVSVKYDRKGWEKKYRGRNETISRN